MPLRRPLLAETLAARPRPLPPRRASRRPGRSTGPRWPLGSRIRRPAWAGRRAAATPVPRRSAAESGPAPAPRSAACGTARSDSEPPIPANRQATGPTDPRTAPWPTQKALAPGWTRTPRTLLAVGRPPGPLGIRPRKRAPPRPIPRHSSDRRGENQFETHFGSKTTLSRESRQCHIQAGRDSQAILWSSGCDCKSHGRQTLC